MRGRPAAVRPLEKFAAEQFKVMRFVGLGDGVQVM
jgi:hypothetical protein